MNIFISVCNRLNQRTIRLSAAAGVCRAALSRPSNGAQSCSIPIHATQIWTTKRSGYSFNRKGKAIDSTRVTSTVSLLQTQDNQIDNEVDQKPIRSPSMRLRFGRRDPMMPLFNEVHFRSLISQDKNYIFVYSPCRKTCCTVMNHLPGRVNAHLRYVYDSESATRRRCWKTRWEH